MKVNIKETVVNNALSYSPSLLKESVKSPDGKIGTGVRRFIKCLWNEGQDCMYLNDIFAARQRRE